jgi:hypothetical protein
MAESGTLNSRSACAGGSWRPRALAQLASLSGLFLSSDPSPMLRHAAWRPAASSLTASVVSGLPPMPHSPLVTSEIFTQVTPRMFSPSSRPWHLARSARWVLGGDFVEVVFFFGESRLHPSAGKFDQAFPNIRLFSFFGQVETLTRICVVLLRRLHHGHTQP